MRLRLAEDFGSTGRQRAVLSLVILLATLLSPRLLAQNETTSAIIGLVTDPTNAALTGATVTIASRENGFQRSVKTDESGRFNFLELKPGTYSLKVEAKGFEPQQIDNVVSGLEQRQAVNFTLKLAQSSQTVTVEAASVDVESVARAHTDIASTLITAIPNSPNGGFSAALTLGTPGVAADSNGSFHPLGEHAEVSFNIDGQPISDQQSRTFSNANLW